MAINYDNLSELQLMAFDKALKSNEKVTRIGGYAGTGKTTVLACLAEVLGGGCVVLAPTNKAAQVLRGKGIEKVQTIHSLLYMPIETPIYKLDEAGEVARDEGGLPTVLDVEVSFAFNSDGIEAKNLPPIALVDEASMIGEDIMRDLLSAFDRVIFFGDPFQLPPVRSSGGVMCASSVLDIEMKEVHRVALENPITRYATLIREGNEPRLEDMNFEEIRHCSINHPRLYQTIADKDVQAICFRNSLRHFINERVRLAKGYRPYTLLPEEPIICLQNIRVADSDPFGDGGRRRLVMYNGQTMQQDGSFEETGDHFGAVRINPDITLPAGVEIKTWPFWNEGFFKAKENRLEWNEEINVQKAMGGFRFGSDFDYAYCLTAHKAQGSEYDKVAVFDERSSMRHSSHSDRQRWFYTSITRAKEKVLVVRT